MENFVIAAWTPLRHTPCIGVILLTAYLTVLVAGLVGNVFVIIVVAKLPKMKTATDYRFTELTEPVKQIAEHTQIALRYPQGRHRATLSCSRINCKQNFKVS